MADPMIYNDPVNAAPSTIGTQLRTDYIYKKALVDAAKESYFGQLANVRAMPKHMGKTMRQYHYLPILDDRNTNDQGLDAAGATIDETTFYVRVSKLVNNPVITEADEADFAAAHSSGDVIYITNSTQWLLLTDDTPINYDASTTGGANGTEKSDADIKAYIEIDTLGVTATVSGASVTVDLLDLQFPTEAEAQMCVNIIGGSIMQQRAINLYGSSKDIGFITGKIPALTETGGRVNRVGMTRIQIEGTIEKFGFFDEYSQESLDFDTDEELEMHITTESVKAANEITEDQLQMDLLNGCGVIRFSGDATQVSELTGEASADKVIYEDLVKLGIELDNNRTPKQTKIIAGSRMVDTKVINAARYMYVGSEMIPSIMQMKDYHDGKAFLPVAQYADAGNIARGEFGCIDNFRIIVVPEMMKWTGVAGEVTTNPGFHETNGNYDVFPMLVVGEGSFATIGFQTDGKTVKFKIKHMKPEQNYSTADPYGETGFYSIKWYYGAMILRSERLAVIKTIAEV